MVDAAQSDSTPDGLTIVMYHYVRDLERSRFPRIKARRTSEFAIQLDHIRAHYNPVTMADVVAAAKGLTDLPPRAALLTFDDGYMDHFVTVIPMLDERGMEGSFFPPAKTVLEGKVLDVNKIQFTLASHDDPAPLIGDIRDYLESADAGMGLASFDTYWTEHATPSRFDTAETMFVKRMLQFALPEGPREALVDILFQRYVTVDEAAFAEELYMNRDQLRYVARSGWPIGCHGYSHRWLNRLNPDDQRIEVARSLAFLADLGVSEDDWIMCYPFGGFDDGLLEMLRHSRCALGLATTPGVAAIEVDDRLTLPRLDTNDLPFTM
jgi:peptidoglycan/xylan/chitin deacetylase (PgdA/CDA1 family)